MISDNFDEMSALTASGPPLVMGIALHANIAGQPFRLRHLRRVFTALAAADHCWFASAGDIAEAFAGQVRYG
jgi:hypothetical protein